MFNLWWKWINVRVIFNLKEISNINLLFYLLFNEILKYENQMNKIDEDLCQQTWYESAGLQVVAYNDLH